MIGYKYFDVEDLNSISVVIKSTGSGTIYVRNEVDGDNIGKLHYILFIMVKTVSI